jgi:hypothetical protein
VRLTRPAGTATALLLVGVLAACGTGAPSASPAPSDAAPTLVAQVASYQIVVDQPGRLLVALVGDDGRWLSNGEVSLNFAYVTDGTSATPPPASHADATATYLPIPGSPDSPAGASPELTLPADGRGVYVVNPITFTTAGFWQLLATATMADGSVLQAVAAFQVLTDPIVLDLGDPAPRTDNPVVGTPGVAPVSIDSRAGADNPVPDPELHSVSIADAIDAGHPALVVFSTPVYCVSRFCGPVTDLVAELAAEYGDRADFIHVEIYEDFQAQMLNQAALDWLMTDSGDLREPWTFLIGADGRIAGSWDTVVTRRELEPLLADLPPKG